LRRQIPDVLVQIVGSGPYADKLKRLARRLAVDDIVEFISVPAGERERLVSILRGADLVVLLSQYESQGLSVLEALALGRRVLVADRAALGRMETLAGAQVVPPRSNRADLARMLANAVLRYDNPPTGITLLRWEDVVDRLLEVYAKALNGKP
jgi:glycosyltransferase involved in cell wall biosynthesis